MILANHQNGTGAWCLGAGKNISGFTRGCHGKKYELDGLVLSIPEWAEKVGRSESGLYNRIASTKYVSFRDVLYGETEFKGRFSMFTGKQKKEIDRRISFGGIGNSQSDIAKDYGVSPDLISKFKRREEEDKGYE